MSARPEPRWWSRDLPWTRDLPLKSAGLVCVTLAISSVVFLCVAPALKACLWHVRHHSIAKSQQLIVKVPWMWRQEETPAGQRELELVRARLGTPDEREPISIRNYQRAPARLETITEHLQFLAFHLGQKDFKATPILLGARNTLHLTCMAPHLDNMQELQASCISEDNLWTADLFGPVPEVESLKAVLQSAAYNSEMH